MPSRRTLVAGYLLLLALSTVVRWRQGVFAARGGSRMAIEVGDRSDVLVVDDASVPIDTLAAPVHLIAFGTGGPPAIRLAARDPRHIKTLTLVDADGIEEFDLLGDHHLNQVLRRAQVIASDLIRWGLPHFGALDHGIFLADRSRALLAADRREIRALLAQWDGPTLILIRNGGPAQEVTAREHARLVPQALLRPWSADTLRAFLDAVDAGAAPTRGTATPARIAAAARPFDAGGLASAQGTSLFVVLALLALIPLLSEDLACVAAGVLAARGSIPLVPGIIAVYAGIVFGDQVLYLLGRSLGRAIVTRRPMRWLLTPEDLDRATEWFGRKGMGVVLTSRFLPGTRFPVYVAAGVLRAGFVRYALWLMVIGAIWTPALVGASYLAARSGRDLIESMPGATWVWAVLGVVGLAALGRWTTTLFTPEGRARVAAFWQRRLGGT